jgi:hypothetical protein
MSDQGHRDEALTRALRAVAEDDETLGASEGVEARLLAEAHVIARERRRHVYTAAGAVAAALLATIAVPAWRAARVRLPAVAPAGRAESSARQASGEVTTEFFPLMYSNVPVTNGQTVRLELPLAALASFGLKADDASGTVLADVLVGEDGLARAVRFVHPAASVFVRPAASVKEQRQ